MPNASALQRREDAKEEAAACGQSLSEAEVLQKRGHPSDLYHIIRSGQGQRMLLRTGFNWV